MTSATNVRAFFQRIAKLNVPQGGPTPPSSAPAESRTDSHTVHESPEPLPEDAARTEESGMIQRKF